MKVFARVQSIDDYNIITKNYIATAPPSIKHSHTQTHVRTYIITLITSLLLSRKIGPCSFQLEIL